MSSADRAAKAAPARQFLRYLLIGGIGFLLDAGATEALVQSGVNVYAARLAAMFLAIVCTYGLHRAFVFKDAAARASAANFSGFAAVQGFASVLNYAVFCWALLLVPQPVAAAGRFFAVCCGVGAGLAVNFLLLRYAVFAAEGRKLADFLNRRRKRRVFFYAAAFLFFCLLPALNGHIRLMSFLAEGQRAYGLPDPDILLRLTQVRQWVAGGLAGFFDHTVYNTNAGEGGAVTPWTRPMDIIVAAFRLLTPVGLPENTRLLAAAVWAPAAICLGVAVLLSRAALARFNHAYTLFGVFCLMLSSAVFMGRLRPGDVDHHGLLTLLWCGVLWLALQAPLGKGKALLLGVFLGLMVWISPETQALLALVYGCLGVYALLRPAESRALFLTTLAAAAVAAAGLMVEIPPHLVLTQITYDSLSLPHVVMLGMTSAAMGLLSLPAVGRLPLKGARPAAYAVAGGVVLAVMAVCFPKFFAGPMADAGTVVTERFLPRINEARPLFKASHIRQSVEILIFLIPAVMVLFSAWSWKKSPWCGRQRQMIVLSVFLAATFLMTCVQLRWQYYLQPVVILTLAALLPGVASLGRGRVFGALATISRKWRYPVAVLLLFWFVFAIRPMLPKPEPEHLAERRCRDMTLRVNVQNGALLRLLGDKPLTVYVPPGTGGDVLFFTPYRIIGSNYHREETGLRDMLDIDEAQDGETVRRILARRGVDYLYYCAAGSGAEKGLWLHRIGTQKERLPAWLEPVAGLEYPQDVEIKPVLYRFRG